MGADKAARKVDGEPVLRRLDRLASAVGADPIYSLRPDQEDLAPAGRQVLHDRWPDGGPLAGIATALVALPGAAVLALAVDMPAIGEEHLRSLLEPWPQTPARCLAADGRVSSLPSLWLPGSRDRIVAEVEARRLAVHAALALLGAERVEVDAGDLINVNAPEDVDPPEVPVE